MSKLRKRPAEHSKDAAPNSRAGPSSYSGDKDVDEEMVFEDPYGDEYEEESLEDIDGEDGDMKLEKAGGDVDDSKAPATSGDGAQQVWRPGVDQIVEGEELDYDPTAYVMYHSFRTEWPCLSFDFVRDNLGDNRQRFPHTLYMLAGSQADRAENNQLTLLQLSDLHKTQVAIDSEDESDDDNNLDEDPSIEHANVKHQGGVNRLRCMPQTPGIVATMADTSKVYIYNLSHTFQSMLSKGPRQLPPSKPSFTFHGHASEGFALDWSPCAAGKGRLVTGDCQGAIHVWMPNGSSWSVDGKQAYRAHTGSVEDLQWSPIEPTVFCSASADSTVRIWDARDRSKAQITIQAHKADVNVISWNRSVGYLLASGSDDGSFKVWDLRSFGRAPPESPQSSSLAHFTYHKKPITSIEWAPHDESVLALSSGDNQVTIWDLSVEAEEVKKEASKGDFPPQLLFIHSGQSNVKEIHHHPQIPGVLMSTAEDSFNVFKPAISVSS